MAYIYRGKGKAVKKARPVRKRTVIRKAIRKVYKRNFARRVKQVINRTAETKVVNYFQTGRSLTNNNSVDWPNSILILTPEAAGGTATCYTISQGNGQGQRTANEITLSRAWICGVVRANASFDLTTNYNAAPLRVTFWIVSINKHLTDSVTQLDNICDSATGSFFQRGNTAAGLSGYTMDLCQQPNTDVVRVHAKRTFKVGMGNYVSSFAINSANNIAQQYNNNDSPYSQMFKIDITKYLPKLYKFNDTNDTPLNVRKRYLMWQVTRVDGGLPQTSTGSLTGPVPAFLDIGVNFEYKDI
ncbi:MAG: hypothetical protein H7836_16940 [Magnetococcus sp. YQC-3]